MFKKLSRELTVKEKTLLFILILMLLGAAYYFFVYEPAVSQLSELEQKHEEIEEDITKAEAKLQEIKSMKKEMDSLEEGSPEYTYMPSYNYEKEEIAFLQGILAAQTKKYNISFSKITRDGEQLRRKFSLTFTASGYNAAEKIVEELEGSDIRCIIGDMSVSFSEPENGDNEVNTDLFDKDINISCTATFYETTYGGKKDSELPADGKSK